MLKVFIFFFTLILFELSAGIKSLTNIRNPFLSCNKKINFISKKIKNKDKISLSGIIKVDDRFGAILERDSDARIVFLRDNVWNFVVHDIQMDKVVLVKGERKTALFLS